MYQFFSNRQRKCEAEFGEVPKVVEGVLAQILDVSVKRQVGVHTHTQDDDSNREWNYLTSKGDRGYGG